ESTDYHVPKDSRTFLKTPIDVGKGLTTASGGQLWYQGIQKALQYHLNGLPLHKSGPTQLWPIMIQLHELPEVPILVIGIYCGLAKPNNVEEYLRPLTTDLNHILENGVVINNNKIHVSIRAFIADSPARAFIKGVANYNAANGCIKCKIVGRRGKQKKGLTRNLEVGNMLLRIRNTLLSKDSIW
uniref:Transposase domain-containing protein n=1 Tax=Anopheles funestus TaxID=62324 RepID=A0A182RJZ8_ANOFN